MNRNFGPFYRTKFNSWYQKEQTFQALSSVPILRWTDFWCSKRDNSALGVLPVMCYTNHTIPKSKSQLQLWPLTPSHFLLTQQTWNKNTPISVSRPVPMTIPRHFPAAMLVPYNRVFRTRKHRFCCSLYQIPGADWAAWLPGTCQVGRLVQRPGGPPRQMLK